MNLSSILVCGDESTVAVIGRVLEELEIRVELCADEARAAVRLAQDRFDLIILDCPTPASTVALLSEHRSSTNKDSSITVVVVSGQESIREMFSLGVNFVLYKPVSYERALSSLTAAQTALFRDKRRKARATVHTHATIDYAGVERDRATLVDLAEDGMAVNFGKRLPPTCKVYFQFQLPGQRATVRLSGMVVWQDWNGRAGVQFMDVPQSSRKLIQEWLKQNLQDAANRALDSAQVEVEHSTRPAKESAGTNSSAKAAAGDSIVREKEARARFQAEPGNRRGQTRYACRLGAEVYQQGSKVRNYCHLSDLSPGGCYLEMPLAFPAGTPVEITVRTQQMKLRVSGEVRASHPGHGMGIAFRLSTRDERLGVQQLIDFVAAATETT
ncbi:MAG TPA: PilZ domain-containing protein [Candidatus Binatia bacterium]|nr:PilZ domain-containing protein [Candidatus Binatia bacterium]